MTGIFVRVERNGLWLDVEVEHLTDEERERVITNHAGFLNNVCRIVARLEAEIGNK